MPLPDLTKNVSLPMATNAPAVLRLHFDVDVPDFEGAKAEERYRDYYRAAAAKMLDELQKHAPGGLVDALFGELAYRKASIFRIADPREP